ncbi:MAG: hypothetical protein OHK0053_19040 [Microscillaceae bacterium]
MNAEQIFSLFNALVLLPWALMIFAPHWRYTRWLATSYLVPLALALVYVLIIFTNLGAMAKADFSTLKGIQALFVGAGQAPYFAMAAWFHYLAFDLMVGVWLYQDAQKTKMSHFILMPCLFLTFMLGPTGFLLYTLLKWGLQRKHFAQ